MSSQQMGTYTEVAKLVATGAIGQSWQGWSVKLSDDGNSLLVGGLEDNNIGAVWFYQKVSSVWTQKQKIVPTGYSGTPQFGYSIAVNPSVDTLIVGAITDNDLVGASYVFTFNGSAWSQQARLVGSNSSAKSQQGNSVGLSADGNTAIVGDPYDASNVGAAWIFVRTGTVWSQQGPKLVGSGSNQGRCVAITSDGNLAVVNGYQVLLLYLRSNGVWSQVGSIASGIVFSLALSGDDQTLVASGYFFVLVFKRNGTTFTQFGNNLDEFSTPADCVAVNKKGTIIAKGDYYDSSNIGAVFMYYFNGTHYNQLGNKTVAPDSIGKASQGRSVSLDGLGSQLLFGGYQDDFGIGAAWIYNNAAITASPSVVPTTQPSSAPTAPTLQPSLKPTTPTLQPSSLPTFQPTMQPSSKPTTQPTLKPTAPTVQPSTAQPIAASRNALFLGLGALIGIIVGGIVLLLVIVAACVFIVCRNVAGGNKLSLSPYQNTMSSRFMDMANPMRGAAKNNATTQDNDMDF